LHICSGEQTAVEAVNAWLARHAVDVVGFRNVYDACVYLLKHYETVPDLALVGTDWLAHDELSIVQYIRETWPRVGVLVYGENDSPVVDLSHLTMTCRSPADLERILEHPPGDVLQRLAFEAHAPAGPAPRRSRPAALRPSRAPTASTSHAQPTECLTPTPADLPSATTPAVPSPLPSAAPRSRLTDEELSALLDAQDER
jgi:hypothetical protein